MKRDTKEKYEKWIEQQQEKAIKSLRRKLQKTSTRNRRKPW
jgi:heme/copper-type cytochrome/quinol oxidase subunit 2